jgi:hypothetical protein
VAVIFSNKNWEKYIIFLIAIGFSLCALILRLDKLAQHNLWNDELFQLSTMHGNFSELIKELPHSELNSYLNWDTFLVYPFFKAFSYNKWGLAIPHIIATILGFYLLYLICRLYFKTIWGYVISFGVVCFNASLINYATEIRPYAVLPTLALASLYLSETLINKIDLSPVRKLFIAAFFLLIIGFHTYGAFILFLSLVFVLVNKPRARAFGSIFKSISKILLIIFLIGLPFWLFCVFGPFHLSLEQTRKNVFEFIPNPRHNIVGFLKGILGNLIGCKKLYFLLVALIFPFVLPYKEKLRQISFLVIMIFFPILLILTSDLISGYWFLQRQFIWVMPFFAFFLGWSGDSFVTYISGRLSFSWYRKVYPCGHK